MDLPERHTADAPRDTPQGVSAAASSEMSLGSIVRPLALTAFLSMVIGRGLAAALPGSRAGIGDWINGASVVGAFLTQLTVILGATLGALLMLTTLWQRSFPYVYRMLAMPAGAAILTLVALSTRQNLSPVEALALAACTLLLSGASAVVAVRGTKTRAIGLILGAATLSALAYSTARGLLWWGSVQAGADGVGWARRLATAGWGFDLVCLTLATATLVTRRTAFGVASTLAALVLGIIWTWSASRSSMSEAPFATFLAGRTLIELSPGPAPILPDGIRFLLQAYALLLTPCLALAPRRMGTTPVAIAFAVLARASPEIPVCALLLVLAAVLAPLGALTQGEKLTDPS